MPNRKRRGRGEHGVFQRESDGLWVASVSLGYNSSGQRKRRVVYGATKQEVLAKLDAIKRDGASGLKVEPDRITVKDMLDRWLELEVRPNRAAGTFQCYRRVVDIHIIPHIGGTRLQDLDSQRVAWLYKVLKENGAKPRTCELAHAVLRRAMRRAVAWKLKTFNPVADVERPRAVRRDVPRITADQANALLEAASGHRLEALFVCAISTGMRQGELFGLRWADVDLAANQIHVNHSLEELNGTTRLKEPKTKTSKRTVELPTSAAAALSAHRERMRAEGYDADDRPVFPNSEGGFLSRTNFYHRVYEPIRQAAGLDSIHFHDWRHFHASQLISLRVDAKVVQERLGHADVATTLRFYVHPSRDGHRAAIEQFDAALTPKQRKP